MNFDFSEDQELVREQVRRALSGHDSALMMRTILEGDIEAGRSAWRDVCEMAVPATALPETLGGNGLGYLDLCVIAEELGAAMTPVPVAMSRLVAMEVLFGVATDHDAPELLHGLAAGERIAALVDCRQPLSGDVRINGGKISGWIRPPFDGLSADLIVLIDRDGSVFVLELAQSGVSTNVRFLQDPAWPELIVSLDAAQIRLVAQGPETDGKLDRLLARSAVLVAFQQLGGARRCLETAVTYVGGRTAFGRPIGSFQALKHMLADLYVEVELARSNCYHGAWALTSDAPDLALAGALAHVSASGAYLECAKGNIQVHGAMGFTWEADCHLHYRRALWLSGLLGGRQKWKKTIAEAMKQAAAQELAARPLTASLELADGF